MRYVFILFIALFSATTWAQDTTQIVKLENTIFKDSITHKKVMLVDVRTPEEFEEGHLEGAVNINYLDNEAFAKGIKTLDPGTPVFLYCRSGNRSGKAADSLSTKGFVKIYDLVGGYRGWVEKFEQE